MTTPRSLPVGFWLVAMLAAACSPAGNSADGGVMGGAACSWPSTLDRSDASPGQCVAARAYLTCSAADGSGEGCLSDDVSQCPGPSATGQTYGNCQNLCGPQEYAVACGGPGPGPWPAPPAGCRNLPASPSGGTISCCPCEVDVGAAGAGGVGAQAQATFDCGGTATCATGSQVCESVAGGAPPGVNFYACIDMPSACAADQTCACVVDQLKGRGAGACSADGAAITVGISVP